jgi:hypothetical protein
MAAAKRAVPVAVIASERDMKANTTMPTATMVGKPAHVPLLVLLHDTFEAFLFMTKNNAPLNEPNKLPKAAQETRFE